MEDHSTVSYKTKYTLTEQSSNHTHRYLATLIENLCSHKSTCPNIYSSFSHSCTTWEKPKCPSVGEWINKLVHSCNRISLLFTDSKKWTIKTHKDMEKTSMHIVKWKKLVWKAILLWSYKTYDSNHMTFLQKQNYKDNKNRSSCHTFKDEGEDGWGVRTFFRAGKQFCMTHGSEYVMLRTWQNPLNCTTQILRLNVK